MKRILTIALAVMMIMAIAAPAMAGGKGQAGKSDVSQCNLDSEVVYGTTKVMFKDNGDGTIDYVLTGHDLIAGAEYEMRSGGAVTPVATGTANKGGNLLIKGTTSADDGLGGRINLWELGGGDTRIARTSPAVCTIP